MISSKIREASIGCPMFYYGMRILPVNFQSSKNKIDLVVETECHICLSEWQSCRIKVEQ